MKPRIRREYGIWVCRSTFLTFSGRVKVMGDGYTPLEAYREWLTQWKRETQA